MPRSDKIISLSKSDPLVRNTMLAMTACHLRHASPGVLQHRIADHFQQSFALEQYRKALCTPQKDLGQSGIDALLLSAVLLNIIAFALPSSETVSRGDDEPDPRTSSIISLDEDLLGWLSLQAGLRPLLKSMATYLPQTLHFLSLIFLGSNKESWTLMREGQDLEEVPATWREVFELDNAGRTRYDEATGSAGAVDISQNRQGIISSMNPKNIFRLPLLILVQLRNLAPVRFNVFQNLQFLGKVDTELRELVRDKDEKALWLIGYWLGLMCRFEDIWWCEKRAKRDYKAIRTWLEQLHLAERPGVEGRRWKEMMKELELAPVFVPTWMTEL
ncbi:MAG: hypothetical protein LQ340_001522 [Diploschistes diacapsis]|nr:MAG: hypothetical protein LQ340_001522 [Diploschistes diacapsis]